MARHYKQTRKDRRDESRGMKRYERDHRDDRSARSDEMMMPREPSYHDRMADETQMYHLGKAYYGPGYGHPANLPPYPDTKYYPKEKKYLHTDDYPDTIREIDRDDDDNMNNLERQPSDSMY